MLDKDNEKPGEKSSNAMNRRNFLALVGALPFVGALVARSAEKPVKASCANGAHYLIHSKWYCPDCVPDKNEPMLSLMAVFVWGKPNPVCGTIDTEYRGKREHEWGSSYVMLADPNDPAHREIMAVAEIEERVGKPFSEIIRNA